MLIGWLSECGRRMQVVSALGSYVYKSGNYDVRADCYHTYFSGAKAKIIETIFTKKELEDNLAF